MDSTPSNYEVINSVNYRIISLDVLLNFLYLFSSPSQLPCPLANNSLPVRLDFSRWASRPPEPPLPVCPPLRRDVRRSDRIQDRTGRLQILHFRRQEQGQTHHAHQHRTQACKRNCSSLRHRHAYRSETVPITPYNYQHASSVYWSCTFPPSLPGPSNYLSQPDLYQPVSCLVKQTLRDSPTLLPFCTFAPCSDIRPPRMMYIVHASEALLSR